MQLSNCIDSTLARAVELNCESLSIPAISSGIFGFPKDLCAEILFNRVEQFAKTHFYSLEQTSLEKQQDEKTLEEEDSKNVKSETVPKQTPSNKVATRLQLVRFTNFDDPTYSVFSKELKARYVTTSKEYKQRQSLIMKAK